MLEQGVTGAVITNEQLINQYTGGMASGREQPVHPCGSLSLTLSFWEKVSAKATSVWFLSRTKMSKRQPVQHVK